MKGVGKKNRSELKTKITFFLLLLVFVFIINSAKNFYKKREQTALVLANMNNEIKNINERKENLIKSLDRLNTDEGLEFEIRNKFNVSRAGESVAIIVDPEPAKPTIEYQKPILRKIIDFVKNIF